MEQQIKEKADKISKKDFDIAGSVGIFKLVKVLTKSYNKCCKKCKQSIKRNPKEAYNTLGECKKCETILKDIEKKLK